MRFPDKRLRLATLMIGALVGLSSLALSGGDNSRSRQSVLPCSFAAGHYGLGAASATPLTGVSVLTPGKAARVLETYAKAPLSFEPRDQSSGEFFSRGQGYSLSINSQEVALTLRQTQRQRRSTRRQLVTSREDEDPPQPPTQSLTLTMKLIGADPSSRGETLDPLPGKRNYFLGNDQSRWRSNVPTFAKLRYRAVYPGVDLVYYGAGQQLEYDFIIAPGADPRKIRLAFDGAKGIRIDDSGDLVLITEFGEARQRRPIVYQETNSGRRQVAGRYTFWGRDQVGFEIGEYDPNLPLVIDPVIVYSTLLGGSDYDSALIMLTDSAGAVYLAGLTTSDDLPARVGPRPTHNGGSSQNCANGCTDAFALKLNAAGTAVEYATYLGGSNDDFGVGLTVGGDGSVYLTGYTDSPDFPVTPGAIQPAMLDQRDAFVARIDSGGARMVYSTYLGGRGGDRAFNVVADAEGNAYVAGRTESSDFPTARAFQSATKAPNDLDGFIAKINPFGTELIFSTYLGGSEEDQCNAIAIDSENNVYVTGSTASADFPVTPGAYQTEINDSDDVFIAKFKPDGSEPVYSTFIGGDDSDVGFSLTLDAANNAVVTGFSASFSGAHSFPLINPLQRDILFSTVLGPGLDTIIFKLSAAGDKLLYSTFLGGFGADDSNGAIAVDARGRIYLSGATGSYDFPVTSDAFQLNHGLWGFDRSDAYVAVIDPSRSGWDALIYSSFLGGVGDDYGQSAAIDARGNFYVAGLIRHFVTDPPNNFPLVNPLPGGGGFGDAFLAKIALVGDKVGDNTPPTITITNPAIAGEYVTDSPRIDLAGAASDNVGVTSVVWRNDRGGVDLSDRAARGKANGVSNWNANGVLLARGVNRLTVTAIDAASNAGSATVTVRYHPEFIIDTIAGNGRTPPHRVWQDENKPALTARLGFPIGIAVDATGAVFFVDSDQGAVRKISSAGIITNYAGGDQTTQASIGAPFALALDKAGNLYVTDLSLNRVHKISPGGIITTVAGSGPPGVGGFGGDGGPATQAQLNDPRGVAVDAAGNVYIADSNNHRIRKVDAATGIITTVAGTGEAGFSGDGGPATQAKIATPHGLAFDKAGNLLISDYGNLRIRRIASDGVINTIAGGASGDGPSGDGGPATQARFMTPFSLTVDASDNIYVAESDGHRIRRIKPDGIIDTIAGLLGFGFTGDGGAATVAKMGYPRGVAADRLGRLYVTDSANLRIRRIAPVSFADTGSPSISITSPSSSFYATQIPFVTISGVASDERGVFQVKWSSDRGGAGAAMGTDSWTIPRAALQSGQNRIVVTAFDAAGNSSSAEIEIGLSLDVIPPSVVINNPTTGNSFTTTNGVLTLGGRVSDANGIAEVKWKSDRGDHGWASGESSWTVEGILLREGLNQITVTAFDMAGNPGMATIAVTYNPEYIISTVAGGNTRVGELGDGKPATSVALAAVKLIAMDRTGAIYFTEQTHHRVRKITPDGIVATVAGTGEPGYSGDGGPATQAKIWEPSAIALDGAGNLYLMTFNPSIVAEGYVRKVDPSGVITTHSVGQVSFDFHTYPPVSALSALAVDSDGNIYFASGNRLRKATPSGAITTIAGNGAFCSEPIGDGGPATATTICSPTSIAFDRHGNIYIAEAGRYRIRKIDRAGIISTVAGTGQPVSGGSATPANDGASAAAVALNHPLGVAFDVGGNLLIAETGGSRIRKVNAAGIISTIAGHQTLYPSVGGYRGDGDAATWAELFQPTQIAVDQTGSVYVADLAGQRIRKLTPFKPADRAVASVSAASFSGVALAPEAIAAAFGTAFAREIRVADTTPLPNTLAGASVKVRDSAGVERLAPLFFVSPNQINFQIPAGAKAGPATVTVTDANGGAAAGVVMISPVAPGLFSANADGQGVAAAVALRIKSDGSQSYETVAEFNAAQNRFVARPIDLGPAADQVFLILFGTGLRNRSALSNVTAQIGGESAEVLFVGAQGGFVGLDQINLRLPRSLAGRGEVNVALSVDGKTANTVIVKIK
ncbi:MAG: SBBP repeat-containing protein [Blastocatellales bacterium]